MHEIITNHADPVYGSTMADEIEDYWEGIRPQRPNDTVPAPKIEEYQEPFSYTHEDLGIGLRAISRLRTELSTREDAEQLERTLRLGLGIPDSIPSLTPLNSLQSWMDTSEVRAALGLQQSQNQAITNLIRAFEALGYRCEASFSNFRLYVALPAITPDNWSAHQLTEGGVQLILNLPR